MKEKEEEEERKEDKKNTANLISCEKNDFFILIKNSVEVVNYFLLIHVIH